MKQSIVVLVLLLVTSSSVIAQSSVIGKAAIAKLRFRIESSGKLRTLITPSEARYFALGVNHIGDTAPPENAEPTARQRARFDAAKNLRSWGFNCAGNGASGPILEQLPFFAKVSLVNNSHFLAQYDFRYADVFSEAFASRVDRIVLSVCEQHRDNQKLIGYYWTDTPRWNLDESRRQRGTDWVSFMRRLPANTAGKQAYIAFLQKRFGNSIARLNDAFRMRAQSFESLAKSNFAGLELDRAREADEAFLGVIAERLYSVTAAAFARHDPEALVFGEKYKAHDHSDAVLQAAAKYVDVISIQPGPEVGPLPGPGRHESSFERDYFDEVHKLTGKPIMICDHAISWWSKERPVTLWHQYHTIDEAADSYARYLRSAAATPYIVGYSRCQYLSDYRKDRNLLKQGLLDEFGKPYSRFVDAITQINRDAIATRTSRP